MDLQLDMSESSFMPNSASPLKRFSSRLCHQFNTSMNNCPTLFLHPRLMLPWPQLSLHKIHSEHGVREAHTFGIFRQLIWGGVGYGLFFLVKKEK